MLNDASGFQKIYLATGYTDLRRGMEGLANIIRFHFHLDPYDRNTLFLFCGKRSDRIKGLLWEGDGFLLLYKRLDTGAFSWPRNSEEALAITSEQYAMLMQGLEIIAKHPIDHHYSPSVRSGTGCSSYVISTRLLKISCKSSKKSCLKRVILEASGTLVKPQKSRSGFG